MYCSTAEDLDISSLVVDNLQLPKEMKITAKLSSLILYKGGNGFVLSLAPVMLTRNLERLFFKYLLKEEMKVGI